MNDHEHNQVLTAAHELYKAATAREFNEYVAAIKAAHKAYDDTTENVAEAKVIMAKWISEAGAAFDKQPEVVKARNAFWAAVAVARDMYQNTENHS